MHLFITIINTQNFFVMYKYSRASKKGMNKTILYLQGAKMLIDKRRKTTFPRIIVGSHHYLGLNRLLSNILFHRLPQFWFGILSLISKIWFNNRVSELTQYNSLLRGLKFFIDSGDCCQGSFLHAVFFLSHFRVFFSLDTSVIFLGFYKCKEKRRLNLVVYTLYLCRHFYIFENDFLPRFELTVLFFIFYFWGGDRGTRIRRRHTFRFNRKAHFYRPRNGIWRSGEGPITMR